MIATLFTLCSWVSFSLLGHRDLITFYGSTSLLTPALPHSLVPISLPEILPPTHILLISKMPISPVG